MRASFWLLVSIRLAAQPACMLEGITTDDLTGKPLAGVKVYAHLAARGFAPAYLRRSDAHGHYCFERLAPGAYHVIAQHAGYLDQVYGARPGGNEAIELTVAGDGPLPEANLKMVPRPILSGTVLHADGTPAPEVEVTAWQKVYTRRGADQDTISMQQTDDRGVFRFSDLAPGTYYLSAEPDSHEKERFSVEFRNGQGERAHEEEAVTYFPGGSEFAGARPISLKSGQELSGLTITFRRAPLRHISGRLEGAAPNSMIYLSAQTDGIDGAMIPLKPDGSFERADLLPGKYTLIPQVQSGDRVVGEYEVDLTNGNAENLALHPQDVISVPLILKTEGGGPPVQPGQFWINLISASQGRSISAHATADGNVEFSHVPPGNYRISVSTQGEPYFLKQVTLNGAVQAAQSLDLTKRPEAPIELTFSSKVASVEGRLREPSSGAVTVLLVNRVDEDSDYEGRTATDQTGRFRLDKIKPGKYRLFAIEGFDDGPWGSPELADALRSAEVELGEGESRQVTVPLVTAKEWNAAVERFVR